MWKLLILRLWPAFIPILLYVLWLSYKRRRANKAGEEKPGWGDGPLISTLLVSLLLAIGSFLLLGLLQPDNRSGTYRPADMYNGSLVPGDIQ
tara:strand:+ start:1410 stop:1685 length:276 start_codon:yes stop_codon:yes gene_type:complete